MIIALTRRISAIIIAAVITTLSVYAEPNRLTLPRLKPTNTITDAAELEARKAEMHKYHEYNKSNRKYDGHTSTADNDTWYIYAYELNDTIYYCSSHKISYKDKNNTKHVIKPNTWYTGTTEVEVNNADIVEFNEILNSNMNQWKNIKRQDNEYTELAEYGIKIRVNGAYGYNVTYDHAHIIYKNTYHACVYALKAKYSKELNVIPYRILHEIGATE